MGYIYWCYSIFSPWKHNANRLLWSVKEFSLGIFYLVWEGHCLADMLLFSMFLLLSILVFLSWFCNWQTYHSSGMTEKFDEKVVGVNASRQDGESGSNMRALNEQILQPVRQTSWLIFKQLDSDDPSIHIPTAYIHVAYMHWIQILQVELFCGWKHFISNHNCSTNGMCRKNSQSP